MIVGPFSAKAFLDLADRLRGVAATCQDETSVDQHVGQVGTELRRLARSSRRLVEPRSQEQDSGRGRGGRRHVVGVDRQRPLDIGFRFSQCCLAVFARPAEARVGVVNVAEQGVQHRRARIEGERFLPAAAGL